LICYLNFGFHLERILVDI